MAVVRNLQNNMYYRYIGENKFVNIVTGKDGFVPDEKAKEIFKINVEATYLCEKYPMVEELIKRLNMKADVGSDATQENR